MDGRSSIDFASLTTGASTSLTFAIGTATAGLSVTESWRQTWFGITTNTDNADSDHDGFTNTMASPTRWSSRSA